MANGFKNTAQVVWAYIKDKAIKVFHYLKDAKMEWIVMISVFIVDLVSKSLVENFLAFNDSVPMIPYFLNAHKVHNYSAAFGSSFLRDWFGDIGARIFFCVFAVAASVAFTLVLIHNKGKSRVFRIALALFVAGAMGNCIDRMALGYVRDFIEFEYFGLTIFGRKTWAYIFNFADVALVTGVLLIVFYFLVLYRDNDKKKVDISIDLDQSEQQGELSDSTEYDNNAEAPTQSKGKKVKQEITDEVQPTDKQEAKQEVTDEAQPTGDNQDEQSPTQNEENGVGGELSR